MNDDFEITDTRRMDLLERLFRADAWDVTIHRFVTRDQAVIHPSWRAWCDAVIWAEAFDAVAEACR